VGEADVGEVGVEVRIGASSAYRHLRGRPLYLDRSVLERVRSCDYGACESACCRFGTYVGADARAAIAAHLDDIRPLLANGAAAGDVAALVPFSGVWPKDRMYPGEALYETARRDGACCFVTAVPDGKSGCAIHKYADGAGLPWRQLKPPGCVLFPLLLSVTASGRVRLLKARRGYCPCSTAAGPEAGERLIDLQRESVEHLFDLTASSFEMLLAGVAATVR
jgi:hypothetical protein